jgi:hypothetical protein
MPKDPKGQKRPAGVIGNAVRVITSNRQRDGEFDKTDEGKDRPAAFDAVLAKLSEGAAPPSPNP